MSSNENKPSIFKHLKTSIALRLFSAFKVPLINFVQPLITELDDETCTIRVPLSRRTKNHVNSMYFGSLCIGADTVGGILAIKQVEKYNEKIAYVFKDLHAEFLKRVEGTVYFTSKDGQAVRNLIDRAVSSGNREEDTINVIASVPEKLGDDPAAKFRLILSVKVK